jgi:hypothetical protein
MDANTPQNPAPPAETPAPSAKPVDHTLQPFGKGVLPVGVERKDASVITDNLVPELMTALAKIGRVHLDLFDKPLVITSGNDGKHKNGSKHGVNKAVDLRLIDKDPEEQSLFLDVLMHFDKKLKLMLFDERQLPGSDHVHIETAD